mmetsp:Transcript_23232/g.39940  ORF Transcript_23232/g.39940 Transcript_23232/m.39940 type:complete len:457 (-) Transcript_23232:364-1734(-)|eukprot:CAMPEP_0196661442 /NCGR_PEP_ID=MMETSP1086-20130531/44317_1 /TAXON_ID=77921 /ORGANISM="Cyanoptyche  gloeocystis , Strain SAG4.97" /LENGTH=456 /DNA_ID=CAMNT_0041996341 /DNA_START=29 /DNA_END=1399 /DNA_ORIENTATION=-
MLDDDLVLKASKALLKHVSIANAKKGRETGQQQLFENEGFIQLQLVFHKVPGKSNLNNPKMIPLAHPLYPPEEAEVCLFVKDPQRTYKDRVAEQGITSIKKVIGVSKLKAKHKTFEARAKLVKSYDVFLCDSRVFEMMPSLLGTEFYRKKKQPVSVHPERNNFKEVVNRILSATPLFFGQGPCSAVKIGRESFTAEQLCENIVGSIDAIVHHIPRRWSNIRSLSIKATDSISLPIYNSAPQPDLTTITAGVETPTTSPVRPLAGSKRKLSDSDPASKTPTNGAEAAAFGAKRAKGDSHVAAQSKSKDSKKTVRKGAQAQVVGDGPGRNGSAPAAGSGSDSESPLPTPSSAKGQGVAKGRGLTATSIVPEGKGRPNVASQDEGGSKKAGVGKAMGNGAGKIAAANEGARSRKGADKGKGRTSSVDTALASALRKKKGGGLSKLPAKQRRVGAVKAAA